MEQHPVPQNVTTFQFRLVGDMTLKQFGYLIGGAILAYIMYKLPLPFFFTWPLAVLCAVAGFGFAFVPVEERPMDVWVLSFFKSIYSPTQYVWQKQAPEPSMGNQQTLPSSTSISPELPPHPTLAGGASPVQPVTRKGDILQNIFAPQPISAQRPTVLTAHSNRGPFDWLFDVLMPKPKTMPPPAMSPIGSVSHIHPATGQMDFTPPPVVRTPPQNQQAVRDAEQKEHELENKLITLQQELQGKTVAESRILELQSQLTELLSEREKMEKELAAFRKATPAATVPSAPVMPPPRPTTTATVQTPRAPTVQIITPDRAVKAGLPRLTTFPNVVTGIVKDKDKNLLPGVLVTVKDKDGVPLRALKTNRLGQFAASTPLPNGTYLVEIEDPRLRYTFDRAQITLNGSIVPALEIFAKTEKEITRAKLEKELFGKPNT